jgi:Arc/MetJ-type ribon-helix-helix transcriptional regulator
MCITIDRKVLEWIQRKVEEGVFASRSHAVEYAVRQLMRQERKPAIESPWNITS